MVKPKCKICDETEESKFYYGKKNICMECLKEENKKKYAKKGTLAEKVAILIEKMGKIEEENNSFKKGFQELTQEIDKLKEENQNLQNVISELRVSRARSPSPIPGRLSPRVKSRSPSPVRSRSPSPVRSRSPSPSPVRARSVSPKRASSPKITNSIPEFPILEAPAPQIKRFSCVELDNLTEQAKFANLAKLKELAKKLNVVLIKDKKNKTVDQLRADVNEKIAKLRTI